MQEWREQPGTWSLKLAALIILVLLIGGCSGGDGTSTDTFRSSPSPGSGDASTPTVAFAPTSAPSATATPGTGPGASATPIASLRQDSEPVSLPILTGDLSTTPEQMTEFQQAYIAAATATLRGQVYADRTMGTNVDVTSFERFRSELDEAIRALQLAENAAYALEDMARELLAEYVTITKDTKGVLPETSSKPTGGAPPIGRPPNP